MTIRIEPYKLKSESARALSARCGILLATPKQVEKHGDFDYIINWGSSERRFEGEYINKPEAVRAASNKLSTAKILGGRGIPQPPFTTSADVAREWLRRGRPVLCRTLLRACGGRGLHYVGSDQGVELLQAPLYTRYIRKTREYRVHVFGGRVIDVQEKRRSQEVPDERVNWQIRNHDNGFVFCRAEVELPDCVRDASVAAVDALALDFGAVDVGYNARRDKCRVYEVNTACGLQGTTLDSYYKAFAEVFPEIMGGAYARRRG